MPQKKEETPKISRMARKDVGKYVRGEIVVDDVDLVESMYSIGFNELYSQQLFMHVLQQILREIRITNELLASIPSEKK